MDLNRLIDAEYDNHEAMVREAETKYRQDDLDYLDAHQPTWGSMLDSWNQMPEDIQREIVPGVDPDAVTEYIKTMPTSQYL